MERKGKMTDATTKGRTAPQAREPREPRSLNIDPQVFANVVEAMHTLAQQQPQITADVAMTRQAIVELGNNVAGLMEDIRAIAQAVGVRPGPPLMLHQGQQQPNMQPGQMGVMVQATRPSREELAASLRSLPGIGPDEQREHAERVAGVKR